MPFKLDCVLLSVVMILGLMLSLYIPANEVQWSQPALNDRQRYEHIYSRSLCSDFLGRKSADGTSGILSTLGFDSKKASSLNLTMVYTYNNMSEEICTGGYKVIYSHITLCHKSRSMPSRIEHSLTRYRISPYSI